MRRSTRVRLLAACVIPAICSSAFADFSLTILHTSDQESALLPTTGGGNTYGGAALWDAQFKQLSINATTNGIVKLSGGDDFLVGTTFDTSLSTYPNGPYLDTLVARDAGIQAIGFSNHVFDLGTSVTKTWINSYSLPDPTGANIPAANPKFITTNLNFSGDSNLAGLVATPGNPNLPIAKSAIIQTGGQKIGIVDAVSPQIATLTSLGSVTSTTATLQEVANAMNAEIASLEAQGVTKIITMSKLQSVGNDRLLVPLLHGTSVHISVGGHEVMTEPAGSPFSLLPVDSAPAGGAYASGNNLIANADGINVPIVSNGDNYKYVGQLVVSWKADGTFSGVDYTKSGEAPALLSASLAPDATIKEFVETPVQQHIAALAATVVAKTQVPLNGVRIPGVRDRETNLGDLTADAMRYQALKTGAAFVGTPLDPARTIGIVNGGGIRNSAILDPSATAAGPSNISRNDAFTTFPFGNTVTVLTDIHPSTLKALLERGVSVAETAADGRFAQVAGLKFSWITGIAGEFASDRIASITLDDGTPIVANGLIVPGAPDVNLAINNFSANGGDGYPFSFDPASPNFVNHYLIGVTDEQALENYLINSDGLNGLVTAAQYPAGGAGRISAVPEPSSMIFLGLAVLGMRRRAKRR